MRDYQVGLLPWEVYDVLSDGRRVLVAKFATRILASDFVEYQATVTDSQYIVLHE